MTITYHRCMSCGEYTPENEARYLGENEEELWLCPNCDKPTITEVTPSNINLLRSGSLSLRIPADQTQIRDLIRNLEFEYHSIQAANSDWDTSLWDFLIKRGITPDDIWEYSPQIGWDAEQDEPDWL